MDHTAELSKQIETAISNSRSRIITMLSNRKIISATDLTSHPELSATATAIDLVICLGMKDYPAFRTVFARTTITCAPIIDLISKYACLPTKEQMAIYKELLRMHQLEIYLRNVKGHHDDYSDVLDKTDASAVDSIAKIDSKLTTLNQKAQSSYIIGDKKFKIRERIAKLELKKGMIEAKRARKIKNKYNASQKRIARTAKRFAKDERDHISYYKDYGEYLDRTGKVKTGTAYYDYHKTKVNDYETSLNDPNSLFSQIAIFGYRIKSWMHDTLLRPRLKLMEAKEGKYDASIKMREAHCQGHRHI